MKRVFITGMSGVGKSSVLVELAARGHKTVDTDFGDYKEWTGDEWLWNQSRIQKLLDTEDAETLFLGGTVRNQGAFRSRFDHVILLDASTEVVTERLSTRTTNVWGKDPEELAVELRNREMVLPLLRGNATLEIDTGTASIDEVADTILRTVES
jgi:dephospho-CoA kinase